MAWGLFKEISPLLFISVLAILVMIRENISFSFSTFSSVQSDSATSDDNDDVQEGIFSCGKYKRMYKVWFMSAILSTWMFYFYFSWAQAIFSLSQLI